MIADNVIPARETRSRGNYFRNAQNPACRLQLREFGRLSTLTSANIARLLFAAFLLLFTTSGCSIQLSPAYDQATYTSLSELNVKTETLFSSLSKGAESGEFQKYKPTYDQLIGGFSAARITTASRPVPSPSQRLLGVTHLQGVCGNDPTNCVNPTPHHLDNIVILLKAIRDKHQQGKLEAEVVNGFNGQSGFKGQYEIEMSRILVFETALQR
ncbi:hypothetical protein [Mesorhizobium sp. M1E.F.Ca.ET.063.01.1.1]|uniref:hypothetical protein n=1 Tax=Mesorhizobium sp. M1E.F.Ca.ET.063.01.1.1 TaxID=2496750 RepID=UPI000FCBE1F7|nr:hypothetical protein [Mesorhizobium sp. M1E.F.Ca.ET.063.01.1.1]RUW85206.1 hypothetical protein EOA29_06010 [Mesorhizobium sp. M1E.F.Ca.ET.063.01.1.1]